MDSFYVYRHIRLDSGLPFYIGKGHKIRAFEKSGHNQYWNRIVKKHGYKVEIMMDNLPESLAFEKEIEFIKFYKSCGLKLTNLTDGGEGISGYKYTPEGKQKMSKYMTHLIDFTATKYGVSKKYHSVTNFILENNEITVKERANIWKCLNNERYTCKGYVFTKIGEKPRIKPNTKYYSENLSSKKTHLIKFIATKDGISKTYSSVTDFIDSGNLTNGDRGNIWHCLKRNHASCKGFTFKVVSGE